ADAVFEDGTWYQDATSDDVQRRLARQTIHELRKDPDVLAEVASSEKSVEKYLVRRAKEALPALADVAKERKLRVKEIKHLGVFREAIQPELKSLHSEGSAHYAENARRAASPQFDPEYERPETDLHRIAENAR